MHNFLNTIIEKKKEDLKLLNREEIHAQAMALREKKGI